MAVAFDRMEFARAMRGEGGLPDEAIEAMADALHKAQETAGLVDKRDLDAVVKDLKVWSAGCAGVLAAFLSAIGFFG